MELAVFEVFRIEALMKTENFEGLFVGKELKKNFFFVCI